MCDEEEKDMATAEAMREVSNKKIPSNRMSHISKALEEVELMQKGLLPEKSARDFLKEIRSKK